MNEKSKFYPFCIALIGLFCFWWTFSWLINSVALPSPITVAHHIYHSSLQDIGGHLLVSLYRVFISLALSLLIGMPLGLISGHYERIDRYISPLIYLLYPVPKIVLLPLILVLVGIGDLSKILTITLIVFFQILVTTRDATKTLSPKLIDSVISMGAGKKDLYCHVLVPACLPKIFTCLRISLGTALAVLFLAETYATQFGIGFYIMDALARFEYVEVYAGICAMSLMGLVLYIALDWAEAIICPWVSTKS